MMKKPSKSPASNKLFLYLRFRHLKIGGKYLLAFLISIILFITATTVVFIQLTDAKSNVSDIQNKSQLAIDLGELSLLIEQKDSLAANYIIVNSRTHLEDYEAGQEQTAKLLSRLEKQYTDGEELKYFNFIKDNIA